jgi:Fur family ferric uptake transcriptional regulator
LADNLEVREGSAIMPPEQMDDKTNTSSEVLENAKKILREHLVRLGLKQSSQRDVILRIFLATRDHLSTEELHRLVKADDPTIGYTTVYRALKLFTECGVASEIEFRDGIARYEHRLNRQKHHHLICTACGDSVEFFAPEVEAAERNVGAQFQYQTTGHNFQIYGICQTCQKKRKEQPSAS